MTVISYKKKQVQESAYNRLMSVIEKLEPSAVEAACKQLGIPYLPKIANRLLAKRLENITGSDTRVMDSILRKPVTSIQLPGKFKSDLVIKETVKAVAERDGKAIEDVNIPQAIPDCWGFYESNDPACNSCPYDSWCIRATEELRPVCFEILFSPDSVACASCLYQPWCKGVLVIEP